MMDPATLLQALEGLRESVPSGYDDSPYYTMGWEDALEAAADVIEGWEAQ